MRKQRAINIASLMMLIWLAFYALAAFVLPKWAGFLAVLGCTVPMLLVKPRVRGETYGTRDCNTVIYKKREYAAFFVFAVAGSALLSALVYVAARYLSAVETVSRTDLPYLLVFSCMLPAFFEEWLLRGGVLGAVRECRGAGVWLTGVLFMLMHMDLAKWPYALFAGVLITALVYCTECIYLGMLLHFLNNLTSLLLSYLPNEVAEQVAFCIIALLFVLSFAALRKCRLGKDVLALLRGVRAEDVKSLLSPLFLVFAAAVSGIMIYR